MTREQAAVILMNYSDFAGYSFELINDENIFFDQESINAWAQDAVSTAQQVGIINGKSDNIFDPQGTATRAEICTMLKNLIDNIQ